MVLHDRVVCDNCFDLVGQLFNTSAHSHELVHDFNIPPYYCLCPSCQPVTVSPLEETRFALAEIA